MSGKLFFIFASCEPLMLAKRCKIRYFFPNEWDEMIKKPREDFCNIPYGYINRYNKHDKYRTCVKHHQSVKHHQRSSRTLSLNISSLKTPLLDVSTPKYTNRLYRWDPSWAVTIQLRKEYHVYQNMWISTLDPWWKPFRPIFRTQLTF